MWSFYINDVFIEFIDTVLYHDMYCYLGMKRPLSGQKTFVISHSPSLFQYHLLQCWQTAIQ